MTIVEAAFVIPLFFVFVFGLIDMGLWTLQKGQASSAARDGARAAIVLNLNGLSQSAIESKVTAAITPRVSSDLNMKPVKVTCFSAGGSTYADCTNVSYGNDRVEVEVEWDRPFLTFIGGLFGNKPQTIKGSSTMVIVGRPAQG